MFSSSEICDFTRHLYFQNFEIFRDICIFWTLQFEETFNFEMVNEKSKHSLEILCRSEKNQMILHKSFDLIVTNLGLSSDFPLLKMPDKDCRACNNCAKPRCDAQLTSLLRYRLAWKMWSYLKWNKIKKISHVLLQKEQVLRLDLCIFTSNCFCHNYNLFLKSKHWAYARLDYFLPPNIHGNKVDNLLHSGI